MTLEIVVEAGPDGHEPRVIQANGSDVAAAPMTVARIVHACHDRTIDTALADLAVPGLTRATLEPILTYCAELRCEAVNATCAGCKRRTEGQGLRTLEDYIRAHAEVVVGDGRVRLKGTGQGTVVTPALETLEKSWSGENYWFWARRVIRKLRHGVRRAHIQGEPFSAAGESPAVLLMEPQLADNIGMVARACANFGLDELRLINPRDGWPNEKARIAASGANYIIDDARQFPTLDAAIGDLNWLAATTARQRDLRKPVMTPLEVMTEIRSRTARGERCGILFGRERNGLETDEVAKADAIVMIPVNSRFASLNLAQSVLILGYEWMRASGAATLGRVTNYETPVDAGLNVGNSRPATKEEMLGFFAHLEEELDRLGFLNPPHKRQTMVRNLLSLFTRMAATEQEVRTLRGVVAALAQGKGRGRKAP